LGAYRCLAQARPLLDRAQPQLRGNSWDGGDTTSEAFYRAIAEKLGLNPEAFLDAMGTDEARDLALYDFSLARQLGADAFPRLYLQTAEDYLYLVSRGYSAFDDVQRIIDEIGV